jgi:hypothetical protein
MNAWIEHVKNFAKENGTSYACALSNPACRAAYQPVAYTKDIQKIGRLSKQDKLQDARDAFNRLRPLIQSMTDSSTKDRYLTLMSGLRKMIQRKMA